MILNSGLSPSRFSTQKLREMIDDIDRFETTVLAVDAAYFMALARLMLHEGLKFRSPIGECFVKDGVPTRAHKKAIRELLGLPTVFEVYGTTEGGGEFGLECEHGNVHYSHEHMLIEVLGRDDRPVSPGQLGRVHLTTLDRTVMPLIRYVTDDLAFAVHGDCPCGRSEPAIGLVHGRIQDLIATTSGAPITPRRFDDFVFEATEGVDWYTLAQTAPKQYIYQYVPALSSGDGPSKVGARLVERLKLLLGPDANIEVRQVAEVAPASSGKFRLTFQDPQEVAPDWAKASPH
jgi:phenylacetate-CoA ligase